MGLAYPTCFTSRSAALHGASKSRRARRARRRRRWRCPNTARAGSPSTHARCGRAAPPSRCSCAPAAPPDRSWIDAFRCCASCRENPPKDYGRPPPEVYRPACPWDEELFSEAQDWISVPSTVKWSFEAYCLTSAVATPRSKNFCTNPCCSKRSRLCVNAVAPAPLGPGPDRRTSDITDSSSSRPPDAAPRGSNTVLAATAPSKALRVESRDVPFRCRHHRRRAASLSGPRRRVT